MDEKKNRNQYFRQYRDANRDRLTEYNRNYYRNNKLKNYKRLATYYQRKAEELEKQEEMKNEENLNGRNEP